jgi:hypothetical protein
MAAGPALGLGSIIFNNNKPPLDPRPKRLVLPQMIEKEIERGRGRQLGKRRRRIGTRLGELGAV